MSSARWPNGRSARALVPEPFPATPRQGVVLLEGPAALEPCGDRPFLAWQLRELLRLGISEILLLTDTLPDLLRERLDAIATTLPRPVPILVSGPDALLRARDRLDARFLLCGSSVAWDGNLAPLLCRAGTGRDVAGIGVFGRAVLDHLPASGCFTRDTLSGLVAAGLVGGTDIQGDCFALDQPATLRRAQAELPPRLRRPALFLDRDGVLNRDHGYVGTRERFEWMPGAIETVRLATASGWHVFVVTNQSGVARGLYDEAAVRWLMAWVQDRLHAAGGLLDDWRYCPHHPEAVLPAYAGVCGCRKPAPGMLLDLIQAWELDPARCVLIGDQPTDLQAAEAAGMPAALFPGGDLAAFAAPLLAGKDA